MRTRATGHSPGGFHVLASPKRVRRQPPPPVRAQPTSINISERSREKPLDVCDETTSASKKSNTRENGKVDDHQSSCQLSNSQKGIIESESQSYNSQSKESCSQSCSSSNSTRRSQSQQPKVHAIKIREGQPKKTKSNRGSSRRSTSKDDFAVKDIVTVEIDSSKCPRDILPRRVQSVLGKRSRDISPSTLFASGNSNEASNHKRARTNLKDPNRSSLLSRQSIAIKTPSRQFDESAKENRFSNSKSLQLNSRELRTETKMSPKSMVLYRARPLNSSPNHTSRNLYSEKKNDAEIQLKQGMQSIMSRMNKYQYQPLPKNPYDSLNAGTSASQDNQSQGIQNKRATPKFPLFVAKQVVHSRGDSYPGDLSESEKNPTEDTLWDRKQDSKDQNLEKRRQKMDHSDNLKDRRIEVEKLFRTTAPNASYQNILRAVAEWAVHNSSTLPTKDEIFTYVESSKAPDATELFSSSERLFPRGNHSKIRKVSMENSASLTTARTKSTRTKNDAERSQNHWQMLPNSSNDHEFSARRVTFDKSIKSDEAGSDTSSLPEEYETPNPSIETPSTCKAQQSKSIASQSWELVTSFKNLVSTPFKVLGFGLGSNTQEAVKSVTKDINFDYKAPTTPMTSSRSAKSDRKVTKNRNVYRTPTRSTGKQTGRSSNRTHNRKVIMRGAVTENRMADLQRELDFKKSQGRERETEDDTNLRRKKPIRNFGDSIDNKSEGTTLRRLNHFTSRDEGNFEEWPPNLDPNRPVVELTHASQILPRGPNGEDVAAMLCSGWLISKHRDSFIRESGRHKLAPAPIRRSLFGPSGVSFSTQNQEPNTFNVIKATESRVKDMEDSQKPTNNNQPGRSYGFKYDDDSSSDDEATVDENISSQSDSKNSNFNKTNVTPHISSGTSNAFNEISNQSKPTHTSDTTVRRLPPTPSTPYTPRMPSTLRNVEALSPYSSKLTTPMSEQNTNVSPSHTSGDTSLVLYDHNNGLAEFSGNHEDWSYVFDLDPQMMDLDPKVIDAVETLSKNSLPSVELPAVVEEFSTLT